MEKRGELRYLDGVMFLVLALEIWCWFDVGDLDHDALALALVYLEDIATFVLVWCFWRLVLWCPSYWLARRSLTLEVFALVDALELWRWFLLVTWTRFDDWRCYIDDLETWHLTWSISWVESQEPCLLVLAWSWLWRGWMMWLDEMMIRQMDMQWQWRYLLCSSLQAGSCTLWGLDSSNPSWLDPREHKLGLV